MIRQQEKFIQLLLDHAKRTNLRPIRIKEKLEDSTHGVKSLFAEIIAETFTSMGKEAKL